MKNPLKRKLQCRFVLLSMLALFLLLGTIVSFSIWHSYRDMIQKSDTLIAQLRETPSANSRYFSVKVHPGKGTVRVETIQNLSITPTQAGEYTKAVLHKQQDTGFVDGYRYQVYTQAEGGMRILFLSRQASMEMHRSYSASLLLFSGIGLLLMGVVLILLSGIVVSPIVDNYNKQKQFITSAGHQLKTPLTVIRTDAQLLEDEIGDNEWISGILAQTDHLTRMTNDLITLSQTEEFNDTDSTESFSLSDTVTEITDLYAPLIKSKDLTLNTSISKNIQYQGRQKELQQLLGILLDNAVKYCAPEGLIDIALKKELLGISIQVTNTAKNMDTYPNSAFTQRFFRGENAVGKEGSGLGLSIAQAIVSRHKGKLVINAGENTFCVNVMLH